MGLQSKNLDLPLPDSLWIFRDYFVSEEFPGADTPKKFPAASDPRLEWTAMFEQKYCLARQNFPAGNFFSSEEEKLSKELLSPWRWKSNNAKRLARPFSLYINWLLFSLLRIEDEVWEFGGSSNMLLHKGDWSQYLLLGGKVDFRNNMITQNSCHKAFCYSRGQQWTWSKIGLTSNLVLAFLHHSGLVWRVGKAPSDWGLIQADWIGPRHLLQTRPRPADAQPPKT